MKLFVDVTMGLGQCVCRRGFELATGKGSPLLVLLFVQAISVLFW